MLILVAADIVAIFGSYFIALWARFEFVFENVPDVYTTSSVRFLLAAYLIYFVVYYIARLYHSIWRYASVNEVYRIVVAYAIIGVSLLAVNQIPAFNIPRSCLFFGFILSAAGCIAIRFGYRLLRNLMISSSTAGQDRDRVLLIGAGFSGCEILRNSNYNRNNRICAVVDDNPSTWGKYLEGVRVAGGRDKISELVKRYHINTILFAIPSASRETKQEIIDICKTTGCRLKTVPSLDQFAEGAGRTPKIRDIAIEDIFGVDELTVDNEELQQTYGGKIILVTGAAGSIGAQLCMQLAGADPSRLILFDQDENTLYLSVRRLQRKYPSLSCTALIGSITDEQRVNEIFEQYYPEIVIHAAAYKQIPLMEMSAAQVEKTNVYGTRLVALAAAKCGTERFILLSAHKAGIPTNLVYRSKRQAEEVLWELARQYPRTIYIAVRFGNVLDTSGSVVPLFREQIEAGGPVTITDPSISRRFISLREVTSLILQTGCIARDNSLYILDQGREIMIDDIARNLIQLAGLQPEIDIPIVYTGLREGESLNENDVVDMSALKETDHPLICLGDIDAA